MGTGSRIAIALFCVVGAAMMLSIPLSDPPPGLNVGFIYVFALFLLLIAIACFSGRIALATRRFVCGVIFLVCAGYVVSMLLDRDRVWIGGRKSQPSVLNSVLAFCVFGLPAGAYALFGGRAPGESGAALDQVLDDDAMEEQLCEWAEDFELQWRTVPLTSGELSGIAAVIELPDTALSPLDEPAAIDQFERLMSVEKPQDRGELEEMFAEVLDWLGISDERRFYLVNHRSHPAGLIFVGTSRAGLLTRPDDSDEAR